MEKNKVGTLQLAVLLIAIITSAAPLVYALTILWQTQAGITILDTLDANVYANSACTIPVEAIDFGEHKNTVYAYKTLFIKNTGTADITLDWSSNVPTTIIAGDDWIYKTSTSWSNIKGYVLKVGEVLETKYEIFILSNAPAGSKTWTLNLGSA